MIDRNQYGSDYWSVFQSAYESWPSYGYPNPFRHVSAPLRCYIVVILMSFIFEYLFISFLKHVRIPRSANGDEWNPYRFPLSYLRSRCHNGVEGGGLRESSKIYAGLLKNIFNRIGPISVQVWALASFHRKYHPSMRKDGERFGFSELWRVKADGERL